MAALQASWTILTILRWTTDYFRSKGVSEPRASAEVLLAHALGLSRLDLYLRYDQPLHQEERARFKALMLKRREGMPVAYLTGQREFWSLDFQVTPAVLIPRPETETLVAATLEAIKESEREGTAQPVWGLEIGVGSGAVVIALATELPRMPWVGVDLSAAALAVAQNNARRHGVAAQVHLVQADLCTALQPQARFGVLVANLPYVPRAAWEQLPKEIKDFEPRPALLGGEDGLDLIRPLVRQARPYIQAGGWILLEVGEGQAEAVTALLLETGDYERVEKIKDFNGIDRVVRARRNR
jgi:release factor glutamine methyltransferase